MDFELFNTYSNKTELFIPLDDNDIRIYACGPTVYDYIIFGERLRRSWIPVAAKKAPTSYPGRSLSGPDWP